MQKIFILIISFLLLFSGPVFATQFGPAEAQVKPGQFSLGVGFFRYVDDWNFDKFTTEAIQNQVYIQAEMGLFPTWEIYLRGGVADLVVDGALKNDDFTADFGPFATGGLKGLFRRGKYLDVGGFAEASYFREFEDSNRAVKTMIVDDTVVANAGLTFQKEIEGALLYGGPFFHYREGNLWFVATNPADSFNGTYEDNSNVGGFLGIRWVALKDIVIEGELQLRDNLSGGASLSFLY